MSDWLLYHVWGIRGYKVARCEMVEPRQVLVTIEATPAVLRCPCCGTKDGAFLPDEKGQICSYVTALKIVSPSGTPVEITEPRHPRLMRLVRSSYGLLGIVYEVTFRVTPLRPLRVRHESRDARSEQAVRNIATAEAKASFDGLVWVAKGADGTSAEQENKNLILSPKARIDTRPQLDIHADDVKAGHGATVGQLSADELFYLRARGIDRAVAEGMLIQGFAGEILTRFVDEGARALAERAVRQVLGSRA